MSHQKNPTVIFLIGFMGSGKTTLGMDLARELNYSFIDLDSQIAQKEDQSIPDIFLDHGEDYFRRVESETLRSLELDKVVIATGGGTPCFDDNIQWMNRKGLTIYLKLSAEELFERLKEDPDSRPLLDGLANSDLKQFIKTLLDMRKEDYESADIIYETVQKDLSTLLEFLPQSK